MSTKVKTILCSDLAIQAIEIMQKSKIYSLVAINNQGQPVGILRMHDLIEAGLV